MLNVDEGQWVTWDSKMLFILSLRENKMSPMYLYVWCSLFFNTVKPCSCFLWILTLKTLIIPIHVLYGFVFFIYFSLYKPKEQKDSAG